MNAFVGPWDDAGSPIFPSWTQFIKLAGIRQPTMIFVFLDEHPDTINDGFFMNRLEANQWGNLPASYHNGAASLSFADGHVASHRWVVPDTVRPARQGGAGGGFPASPPTDYEWLKERSSTRKN